MKDAGCNSIGVNKNHKDFMEKSMESLVSLEHKTQHKNKIPCLHKKVQRVCSKTLGEVFAKKTCLT